jgi:uncharacterized membrane protein HdeD (DUF308 family)
VRLISEIQIASAIRPQDRNRFGRPKDKGGKMNDELGSGLKQASRRGMVFGIALVILGFLAILAPMFAGSMVSMLIGVLMVAAGIARLIWAFSAGSFGKGILTFLLGGLLILTGLVMLFRPGIGMATLAMILAIFFLADGIFEIVAAFKVKPEKGWGWLLFGGIVSIILAGLIFWQWPFSGMWAVGVLVGVKLLFAGFAIIALGSMGSSVAKRVANIGENA